MNKAIFLDRDGTIIVDKNYLNDPKDVEFLPKAIEGLKQMQNLGFKLIVVSNQSGVFRGLVTEQQVHDIHQEMQIQLAKHGINIEAFYYSPHGPDSNHQMRKPNPGMIELAIKEHNLDRSKCWMIGDKMSDVEAGQRAQLKTIFIYGKEDPDDSFRNLIRCDDLKESLNYIS